MGMEDIVLLGGFAAIAVFGYFLMARLDHFLDQARQEGNAQEETVHLNIAVSCLAAIPSVSHILEDIRHRYPHVQCSLSVGQDQDVIQSFDGGTADVAIVSAGAKSEAQAQWVWITLAPQPFCTDRGNIEINTIVQNSQRQKVLWKSDDSRSPVSEFIHQLRRQQP